ncbi:Ubiquitinconjugating enzyme [Leishmania braziliensis]|nr:Ubiquitinconjugating enzyme [Leishmania braziliensis]
MASPFPSSHEHSTTTRDYLFRTLYLRREMLLLATHGTASEITSTTKEKDEEQPSSATSVEPASSTRQDVLLLPPLYSLDGLSLTPSASDESAFGEDPMLKQDHAWNGLVRVRSSSSPWHRGCFAFYVYFPSRYPFEPPIIELAGPLRSHPLLQERCLQCLGQRSGAAGHPLGIPSCDSAVTTTRSAPARRVFVPFEEVYATIDPMRVSVMSVLIRHMHLIFHPAEWPVSWRPPSMEADPTAHDSSTVNHVLARRDVERRSVTQEVLLLKPFEQYVGTEVMEHFLNVWEASEGDAGDDVTDTVTVDEADWYTREVLPHLLHS